MLTYRGNEGGLIMSMLLHSERVLSFRESAVSTAIGYGQVSRGVTVPDMVQTTLFFSLSHRNRFRGPPNFISNGCGRLFLRK
jgi:hypothetical protein